jgi:hypothetical protein
MRPSMGALSQSRVVIAFVFCSLTCIRPISNATWVRAFAATIRTTVAVHSKHLGEKNGCRGRPITTRTSPSGLRTLEICAESSPTRIPDRLLLITVPANSTLSVEAGQTRQLSPKLNRHSRRRSSEAFLGTKTSWDRPLLVSAFVMTVPFCLCGLCIVLRTRWSKAEPQLFGG